MGDVVVGYMEADDVGKAMHYIATSDEPFERWFREEIREMDGISLGEGSPESEKILDYRADA